MEILRDGASAIYGADAVAGVVNNVMQSDYEGFLFRVKQNSYDHFDANDTTVSIKFGKNLNGGRTNISVFADYYDRERIMAAEDARWGDSDHRKWTTCDLPEGVEDMGRCLADGNPWAGSTSFRNLSTNSLYGQFDMVSSSEHGSSNPYNHVFTDSNGEFEVFPLGDSRCSNRSSQGGEVFDTGYGTCIAQDGNGVERFNLWGDTDYRSALERYNVFVFINHEMDNGNETFTEIGLYGSDSNLTRHPSYAFSSAKHRVGPDNYWLNQMTLDDGTALFAGHELWIDNYRYAELYRKVDVKKTTYRILQGIRGSNEDWDWEAAFLNSRATANDVTHNRLSNNLIKEALWDSTPAAYNPFKAGDPEGLARAVVDAYRKGTSELTMLDFKVSNNEIAQMPAGPLGLLLGFEYRYEKVMDDRDPRLDGSIAYTDYEGDTYPLVSDLLNSSPTGDVGGSHRVKSFFTELQIPLAPTANAQLALRFEDSTSVDSALVGKFAVGWDVNDIFKLRASISTAYRAPNIIQVNEKIVVRSGTRNDYSRYRLQQANGISTSSSNLDSRYGMLRQATGAENLKSEESDNTSIGFVLTPVDGLTITADYWTIEKENTIGLFGRSNHTVQDMMLRWANGTNNCGSFMGNPAVVREAPDEDDIAGAAVAGVCPFGTIKYVGDNYLNLATRTIEGYDIGVYYDVDTDFGDFAVRYIGSFIDKFEQVPGGEFAALAAAQAAGQVPADIPLDGFGDLLGQNGNYDEKHRLRLTWSKGSWGASLTGLRKGDFYQSSLTRSDGTRFVIPSMTVFDVTVDYKFSIKGSGSNARIRFAVKNAADERAPTADRYYGYFADAHTDLGRNFYVDFRVSL
jgi:outer membrane receptor protein involved in Fe transport